MILKLLDKLGRKKLVLDRGPSHSDYKNAKPWIVITCCLGIDLDGFLSIL